MLHCGDSGFCLLAFVVSFFVSNLIRLINLQAVCKENFLAWAEELLRLLSFCTTEAPCFIYTPFVFSFIMCQEEKSQTFPSSGCLCNHSYSRRADALILQPNTFLPQQCSWGGSPSLHPSLAHVSCNGGCFHPCSSTYPVEPELCSFSFKLRICFPDFVGMALHKGCGFKLFQMWWSQCWPSDECCQCLCCSGKSQWETFCEEGFNSSVCKKQQQLQLFFFLLLLFFGWF